MRIRNIVVLVAALCIAAVALVWLLTKKAPVGEAPHELTFRLDSFAISLYPPTLSEINSRRIDTLLHKPLVRMTQDGQLQPAIATSWKHDGSIWRFTIGTNNKFSDGKPVTPVDVVTSICRSMQPSSAWGWALTSIMGTHTGNRVSCDGITASGKEVIIRQSFDAPWLIQTLSGPAGWIIPAGADKGGPYGAVPGAGQYKVATVVPDSYVLLQPVDPASGLPPVRFLYVPDDVQAASLFKNGQLASLYLQSPILVKLLGNSADSGSAGTRYQFTTNAFDRMRILIVNEQRLATDGLSPSEIRTFRDALDVSIDRKKLEEVSAGLATGDAHVLPIFGSRVRSAPAQSDIDKLPALNLTIITEPDAYSDQIAATLPKHVGKIALTYRTLEKGLLINSIIKKDFDIGSIVIEATMHSPKFWTAFFDPNGAFVAFGNPVSGIEKLDLADSKSLDQLQELLADHGSWISLLREKRIDTVQPWLRGMRYNPSGQDDLNDVTIQPVPSQ
jgi:ABC-type transport system substrate-binding protein